MLLFLKDFLHIRKGLGQLVLLTIIFAFAQTSVLGEEDPNSTPEVPSKSYLLRTGDLLSIKVFGQDDLNCEERLDGDGRVRLPLLGNVALRGLSRQQAELYISEMFTKQEYLRSPEVSVNIVQYARKFASVFGEVKQPGIVDFPEENNAIDIIELVASVGGFTPVAKKNSVLVTRTNQKGEEIRFKVDVMDKILGESKEEKTFWVKPGDVIYVPASIF